MGLSTSQKARPARHDRVSVIRRLILASILVACTERGVTPGALVPSTPIAPIPASSATVALTPVKRADAGDESVVYANGHFAGDERVRPELDPWIAKLV